VLVVPPEHDAVIPGALVQNVSLGLAMCAERAALFSTVARGADKPETLALVAPRASGQLTWPCGACLQVAVAVWRMPAGRSAQAPTSSASSRARGSRLPRATELRSFKRV
jgi:cytidine deaminase